MFVTINSKFHKLVNYILDNTVVAVAIYGPVEVKQHKMLIDKAYVEVFLKPKCGISRMYPIENDSKISISTYLSLT